MILFSRQPCRQAPADHGNCAAIRARSRSSTTRMTRPVSFDAVAYKHRNVVQRFYSRMKNWRGLASCYDKLAVVFRGSIVLAAIVDWLA
jgi:transposase